MADWDAKLAELRDKIQQRAYVQNDLNLEEALFLLGGAMAVAEGLEAERDRLRAALEVLRLYREAVAADRAPAGAALATIEAATLLLDGSEATDG